MLVVYLIVPVLLVLNVGVQVSGGERTTTTLAPTTTISGMRSPARPRDAEVMKLLRDRFVSMSQERLQLETDIAKGTIADTDSQVGRMLDAAI